MKYLILGDGLLGSTFGRMPLDNEVKVLSKAECNITNKEDIMRAIEKYNPDVVVNCAGIVPKYSASLHEMFKVNAIAPHFIAAAANYYVHISTDCVFSGERGHYIETDIPDSTEPYGLSKALGEPETGLVIRTSFVGLPDPKGRGLLAWASEQYKLTGYDFVVWNGITTLELVRKIYELVECEATGIRHIYGIPTTKYAVLDYANAMFFNNEKTLVKESRVTTQIHRDNKTLSSIYATGFVNIPIYRQFEEMKQCLLATN